ncbi:MAG: YceI family protein [Rickettsiales bacterium]
MKLLATACTLTLLTLMPAYAETVPDTTKIEAPAGNYNIDPSHATLIFKLNHLGFSNYTARFTGVDANLKFDPKNPKASSVNATIDANSLTLDNPPPGFTDELRGDKWLDTKKYPKITFVSKSVDVTGANTGRITGDLTLHGKTHPVTLETTFNGGYAGHPMDPHARIGFSAHGVFKRSDFDIAFGIPPAGSTMGVGDEVTVIIEAEFTGPALKK